MKKVITMAAMFVATLSASSFSFAGNDNPTVTKDNAQKFSQLLDTNFMRLLEIELNPGEFTMVHANPEHRAFAATSATLLVTTPDGKTDLVKVKAGDELWSGVTSYKTVNVGKTAFKAVVYEDKQKENKVQPAKFLSLTAE